MSVPVPAEILFCLAPTPTGTCGQRAWRIAVLPGERVFFPVCSDDEHVIVRDGIQVILLSQMLFLGLL